MYTSIYTRLIALVMTLVGNFSTPRVDASQASVAVSGTA